MACKDDHQEEEEQHHVLGDALQASLQVKAQDGKSDSNGDQKVENIDAGVRDHSDEGQIRAVSGKEHYKVIDHPARDDGIERHQGDVSQHCQESVDMPFLSGLLKLLVHLYDTCLGSAAEGEFHDHGGQTQEEQA